MRLKNRIKRPELIIIDDMEDSEVIDVEIRGKIKKWFHTAFKVPSDEELKNEPNKL